MPQCASMDGLCIHTEIIGGTCCRKTNRDDATEGQTMRRHEELVGRGTSLRPRGPSAHPPTHPPNRGPSFFSPSCFRFGRASRSAANFPYIPGTCRPRLWLNHNIRTTGYLAATQCVPHDVVRRAPCHCRRTPGALHRFRVRTRHRPATSRPIRLRWIDGGP